MTETLESSGFQTIATTVVTKTQIGSDIVLPKWARQIVSIKPIIAVDIPTTAEGVLTKYSIESDDIAGLNPFEVLGTPIGPGLGAQFETYQEKPEVYYVGCPAQGGERIRAYCQVLVSSTSAVMVAMEIRISDQPPQYPQRHAKIGTATLTGAVAATDVQGTAYQIVGGNRIVELQAIFSHVTPAAASSVIGYFKYTSSEFEKSMPVKMHMNPVPSVLGAAPTISTVNHGVNRNVVDIGISPNTTIQDYFYMGLAPTIQGYFVTGVIYQ